MDTLTINKQQLHSSFSMNDMGPLQYCLGTQVMHDLDSGTISLSQSTYMHSLLHKFHMATCSGVPTPLPANVKPSSSSLHVKEVLPEFPFANILGSIHYLVTCTRPDICFAANYLSRFMQNAQPAHVQYLKHLLRYLQHTQDYCLVYKPRSSSAPLSLLGYSNADWGGDPATMQSTSGFVYLLAGALIAWQSKKQDRVTLSSMEAEYVSLTLALKQGMWLKSLLEEMKLLPRQPMRLHCDNLSAIILAKNLKHSEKTKHIALKLQFILESVQEGTAELVHVCTQYQWADFLTKSLPKVKHLECCTQIGINSL
ncbi:hypothetical protein KP509_1Z198700 [Ceratopteris richardii]|nr:hypothetical protein KP509_1Z198700 [Ceratopteris richardii]